jgi:signal transduction histidine kinase
MILGSVRDLKALISEFTRFARLPPLKLQPRDVNALVRELLAVYEHDEGSPVRVRAELGAGLPDVDADAEQLKRVLLNVLNNALEAMAGRTGEVVVRTMAAGSDVVISVQDSGVGIEEAERVFEPHYTTKPRGTGLGLAISNQIVEEHGGRIDIESALGVGTTVHVRLPARAP